MSKVITITEDQFFEQFKPIQNHLDDNASFDGQMFETYGAELDFVHAQREKAPLTIWTILDCDGKLVVGEGYHHVNRMGYLITEVPAEDGVEYIIEADEDDLIDNGNIETIATVAIEDLLDDETDGDAANIRQWLVSNASWRNVDETLEEYMFTLDMDYENTPEALLPIFNEAKIKDIGYLMLHANG